MAWTTMHFAMGMGCAGAVAGVACFAMRRGWRWLPLAMTAGGVWAILPDVPRVFREDFPSLPFAATLGDKALEHNLHRIGDVFFFHRTLDAQPYEHALAGMAFMLVFYNLAILLLMYMEHRTRRALQHTEQAWQSHKPHLIYEPDENEEDGEIDVAPHNPVIARIQGEDTTRVG